MAIAGWRSVAIARLNTCPKFRNRLTHYTLFPEVYAQTEAIAAIVVTAFRVVQEGAPSYASSSSAQYTGLEWPGVFSENPAMGIKKTSGSAGLKNY
jgi:hypothetical protein